MQLATLTPHSRLGWRIWQIENHRLTAPFLNTELPRDGVLKATCNKQHQPPVATCRCGIHYMTDIHRLADYFSNANRIVTEAERPTFIKRLIEQGEWAVTCGLADGPVMLDGDYGHSLRCATYRTRLIVGPANLRKHYDLPVITHS